MFYLMKSNYAIFSNFKVTKIEHSKWCTQEYSRGGGGLIIMFRSYIAHIQMASLCARGIITPALAPMQPFSAKSIQGINSCWVPIYYTWVERDNCGQNALSKGIHTEWDLKCLNPPPSDCKSRARTTTPQCSLMNVFQQELFILKHRDSFGKEIFF